MLYFKTVDDYGNKLEVDLLDDKKKYEGLLTTLIIGPNGTRKSTLLSLMTDVFRELDDLKALRRDRTPKVYFEMVYKINDNEYSVENNIKGIYFFCNKKQIYIEKLELPQRVLAVSYMVNDKFVFNKLDDKENGGKEIYRYLGVRQASNITFINTIVRNIIDRIIKNSSDQLFLKRLKIILEFLDIKGDLEICFEPKRRKNLFESGITNKDIKILTNRMSNQASFRSDKIKNFSENDLLEISNFINTTSNQRNLIATKNSVSLCYNINLHHFNENTNLIHDYPIIQKLISLDYILTPTLRFKSENQIFDFEGTSSGEKHFLFTMLSIASEIKNSSVIFMDEPELSLHPNWQIKYISCLKKIFKDYSSCHVIIATHSHFMLSDLEAFSSSIVSLRKKTDNSIDSILHDENTFGWSVEDILYNIFGVITTRNLFVAKEVDAILEKISKGEDLIEDDIKKLIYIKKNMNENDPLNGVLKIILGRFDK